MATLMAAMTDTNKSVGMGQIVLARSPARLTAVLGSCIAIALYHRRLELGILGHVVLPHSGGRNDKPGKFADTAVPHMMELLAKHGATPTGLVAKIVGGACMFGKGGPVQIGDANAEVVLKAVRAAGIRIAAKDIGGNTGRRIAFDCASGSLTIERVGHPPRTL